MATDLQPRKPSTKTEANLQRKFADLCTRIHRVDLLTHLLALILLVLVYACFIGLFDWFAGNSDATSVHATRWISGVAFFVLFGFLLVRTIRCAWSQVNPYYVAHLLEKTNPNAKNSLINWLDLNGTIPSAFQKNLSTSAAEQWKDSDIEQTVTKRKNWFLLGSLAVPVLGLLILLIVSPALPASMLRAFVPFYSPQPMALTRITLLQPTGGNAEVRSKQSLTIVASIEGRVPVGSRPDAPRLLYRNQINEDYRSQRLQQDSTGNWATQLSEKQISTGVFYKITAGDEQTPEYQIALRTDAYVKKYEITYHHPAYRKLPKTTSTFPNSLATNPIVSGQRGSKVEMIVRTSRPWQKASLEIMTAGVKKDITLQKVADDAFACEWPLDQPGKFRVTFTLSDGEANIDCDWRPIEVPGDAAPNVVLTQPATDVSLPVNGTLELQGHAVSHVGVKSLVLHFRVVKGPLDWKPVSRVFLPGTTFQRDDGTFHNEIEYQEVIPLNQLKNDKGTVLLFEKDNVIEYWLEATDCTDYQKPLGNVGKSLPYKVTFLAAPKDAKLAAQQESKNKAAQDRQKKFQKEQGDKISKENKSGSQTPNGGAKQPSPQEYVSNVQKDNKDIDEKIRKELEKKEQSAKGGKSKGRDQPDPTSKEGPSESPDNPQAQNKDNPMPDDAAGAKKDKGDGDAGKPKENGKDEPSKGERKDGPKDMSSSAKGPGPMGTPAPMGGAKDSGAMGTDKPKPGDPKDPGADGGEPMPMTKGAPGDAQAPAGAKGIDANGPQVPNKTATNPPPDVPNKGGTMTDAAGESKKGPPDQAKQPGTARSDETNAKEKDAPWDKMAKLNDQLSQPGAKGDDAGKELADVAKNSDDPRKRDLAKEMLKQNGRDPKTGKEEKKGPNTFGSGSKSVGVGDDVKAAVAKREFAALINQMQFDDLKKKITPDLLKQANISEAEWQRRLKNNELYDAEVRKLNAAQIKNALKKQLTGGANPNAGAVDLGTGGQDSTLQEAGRAAVPRDLREPIRRLEKERKNP